MTTTKRNISLELLRILSSFSVIMIHIVCYFREVDGQYMYNIIFFESFIRYCVPVFFMLTGFFIFKSKKTTSIKLKDFCYSIVVPTIITLLFLQIFDKYLNNTSTFFECLLTFKIDWRDLLSHMVKFSASSKNSGYLWYIYSLAIFYLWLPLLQYISSDTKQENKIRRSIMFIAFIVHIVIPTLSSVFPRLENVFRLPSVIPGYEILYILIGNEFRIIYDKNVEHFTKRNTLIISLFCYLLGVAIAYLANVYVDIRVNQIYNQVFLVFNFIGIFIQALGLFVFFLCLENQIDYSERFKKIVIFVSSKTFLIYLIHWPFTLRLFSIGLVDKVYTSFGLLGFLILGLIIMFSCLIIAYIINYTTSRFKNLLNNKYR